MTSFSHATAPSESRSSGRRRNKFVNFLGTGSEKSMTLSVRGMNSNIRCPMGMCASSWDDEAFGSTFVGINTPSFPEQVWMCPFSSLPRCFDEANDFSLYVKTYLAITANFLRFEPLTHDRTPIVTRCIRASLHETLLARLLELFPEECLQEVLPLGTFFTACSWRLQCESRRASGVTLVFALPRRLLVSCSRLHESPLEHLHL